MIKYFLETKSCLKRRKRSLKRRQPFRVHMCIIPESRGSSAYASAAIESQQQLLHAINFDLKALKFVNLLSIAMPRSLMDIKVNFLDNGDFLQKIKTIK